jgi:predicted transcriptional regulator
MGFEKKIKLYFKQRGLSNRDVAKIMETSEVMIGKFINTDNYSKTFIEKLIQHFPDVSIDYLIKDTVESPDQLNEPSQTYNNSDKVIELIADVEDKLKEIKKLLAQNCHNK